MTVRLGPGEREVCPLGRRGRFSLTWEMRRAYDAIVRHIDQHGRAPSLQEMADALGLRSRSAALRVRDELEERGWIKTTYAGVRNIALVPPVMRFPPPAAKEVSHG